MNKVFKKRVVLIRAMVNAVEDMRTMFLPTGQVSENDIDQLAQIVGKIRKDDKGHFISIGTESTKISISYAKTAESRLDVPKRIMTGLARYFGRQYPEHPIPDAVMEKYERRVNAQITKKSIMLLDTKIKMLRGKDIRDFYKTMGEQVTHSCMTGPCSSFKVVLYELNPDKVSLIVFDEQIRALLWKCDDGTTVLDRAYPSGHHKTEILRTWAESKGYILRANPDQNIVDQTIALSDGSSKQVTLKHNSVFPFMDLFRYGKFGPDNTVTMSNDINFGNLVFKTDQGTYVEILRCSKCGSARAKMREVLVGGTIDNYCICDACYSKMFLICSNCSKNASIRNIAIDGTLTNGQHYCKKCAITMQKFVQFNDCHCSNCESLRKRYREVFRVAKLDLSKDLFDHTFNADNVD